MGGVTRAPRYRRRGDLLHREGPGFVALATVGGTSVTLTGSGASVWGLLDEPRTITEMAQSLARTYDADADRIADDIRPLLSHLEDSGFVTTDG